MGAVPALGGLMQMGPAPVARGGLTPTASPAARELLQVTTISCLFVRISDGVLSGTGLRDRSETVLP